MWLFGWLSFCTLVAVHTEVPNTLRMVHYLFRHGDRSPMRTYDGDPNPVNKTWPKGFGQLTTVGMRQHHELGRYFRQRYDGFICKTYYNKEVHIVATDVDRTLMSAYSHLSGLYPPYDNDVWDKKITWQPIPVHTVPVMQDFILRCDDCPRKEILRKNVFEMPFFVTVAQKYALFLNWFSAKMEKEYDIRNIFEIADPIYIESLRKLPVPEFVNGSVLKNLIYLDMINFKSEAYTPELQRVTGGAGPLLKDVIERIKLKIAGKLDPDLKLYIYSAHDSTVGALLHSIKSFNDICPPYTATVIMELHQIYDQYYLQFSYKNDSTKEPYDILIPGCEVTCPFEKFLQLTKPIISDDVERECKLMGFVSEQDSQKVEIIIFASIACVSIMIVLFQVVVILLISRRSKQVLYSRVNLNM